MSCTGKKPLGISDVEHDGEDEREDRDEQRGALAVEHPGEHPAVARGSRGRTTRRSSGRSGLCSSGGVWRRSRAHIIGVSVSDTTARDQDRDRERDGELAEQAARRRRP